MPRAHTRSHSQHSAYAELLSTLLPTGQRKVLPVQARCAVQATADSWNSGLLQVSSENFH